MNAFIPRILVAENQYIIGLEAQRIMMEARPCAVTICRRDELARALTSSFDLVFVDAAPTPQEQARQAELIHATGAGLIFMHAGQLFDKAALKGEPLAVFEKPFNEDEIRQFILELPLRESAAASAVWKDVTNRAQKSR